MAKGANQSAIGWIDGNVCSGKWVLQAQKDVEIEMIVAFLIAILFP